jgi:hypothetical protein
MEIVKNSYFNSAKAITFFCNLAHILNYDAPQIFIANRPLFLDVKRHVQQTRKVECDETVNT